MRTLRILTFLLIATCVLSAENQREPVPLPPHNFATDFEPQNGDRTFNPPVALHYPGVQAGPFANTCYFIRSYIMKREGETGATHLDHVQTCTPTSRIRMKTKVKFTPAVEK